MTKAHFVFDHTTKNSQLEGVTITAGAQAPSGSRARRPADEATPSRAATRSPFPLPSNAERLEYEPATQLPQSGLVQWAISVAMWTLPREWRGSRGKKKGGAPLCGFNNTTPPPTAGTARPAERARKKRRNHGRT